MNLAIGNFETPPETIIIHFEYKPSGEDESKTSVIDLYLEAKTLVPEESEIDIPKVEDLSLLSPKEIMDRIFNANSSTIKNRSQLAKFLWLNQSRLNLKRRLVQTGKQPHKGIEGQLGLAYRGIRKLPEDIRPALELIMLVMEFEEVLDIEEFARRVGRIVKGEEAPPIKEPEEEELFDESEELIEEAEDDFAKWTGRDFTNIKLRPAIVGRLGFYQWKKNNGKVFNYPYPQSIDSKFYIKGRRLF